MPTIKKHKAIHKIPKSNALKEDDALTINASAPEDPSQEMTLPHLPMKNPLPCDPRLLCNLPTEQRQKVKEEHPEMSPHYFMTAREKGKFFHNLNLEYRKSIQPSQPPGSAPKKKTISFKIRYEVRTFKKKERSSAVKNQKSVSQLYRAEKKQKGKRPVL